MRLPAVVFTPRLIGTVVTGTLLTGTLMTGTLLMASQSASRTTDEAAVRGVVERYVTARDIQDPKAVEALFTSDADQHTTAGEWRRGRAAIVRGTAESSQRNPGTRRIVVETVRFVTPDVAIADGPYEIQPAGGGAPRRMWATIVVTREAGTWRIAAIRNMVPTGS